MPILSELSKQQSKTIKLDAGQQAAIDIMQSGRSVFLTGMAGTGKSATLCQFLSQSYEPVAVTATTGIAALNLQDQYRTNSGIGLPAYTIYRWAGILTGPLPYQSFEDFAFFLQENKARNILSARHRIQRASVLVIDEISMLHGRLLDFIDFYFRRVRSIDRPFGGIQMIFVGDFLQLPPVSKTGKYDWAFMSKAWIELSPLPIYLKNIHRQDEPLFIEALNNFREGRISQRVANTLASRVSMFTDRKVPRLFTHNAQVDRWNACQIADLDGEEKSFSATYEGNPKDVDFLKKNSVTPAELTIKEGARVMVTANITDESGDLAAVNGQLGTVHSTRTPIVLLDNGHYLEMTERKWTLDPQNPDSASMTQIPLKPAYAISIHKSQGLTLPCAHIDIRAAREPGQAYVALSRLKSLSGLHLKDWIKGVHVSPDAINFYRNL
jgi:hypothetical protein